MAAYLPTPRVNLTAICSRRPLGIHLDAASFCFRAHHCATAPCVAMLLRSEWSALAGIFHHLPPPVRTHGLDLSAKKSRSPLQLSDFLVQPGDQGGVALGLLL